MIESFACLETKAVFNGLRSKILPTTIQQTARRKLVFLNEAQVLTDLRSPPGNRLEVLKGNRAGQHSIRINQQWRICFIWKDGFATDVEIIDYH